MSPKHFSPADLLSGTDRERFLDLQKRATQMAVEAAKLRYQAWDIFYAATGRTPKKPRRVPPA